MALRAPICATRLGLNVAISFVLFVVGFNASVGGQEEAGSTAPGSEGTTLILPVQLKCEHLTNPLGIEAVQPRLSWVLESGQRGQAQTAYQILVASSQEKLGANNGDKWDSGKIASDNSVEVSYPGNTLVSTERCYWKVRVWDKDGRSGAYSEASFFEMGLLRQSDWHGKWIGSKKGISSPLLRKEFRLEKTVKRARVYISGLGYHELYINGSRVGDYVLEPASTYYTNDQAFKLSSRVLYLGYDVTDLLRAGPNVIGVMLGNGWYSAEADVASEPPGRASYSDRPGLILQMNMDFADARSISLNTDENWTAASGPISYNDLSHGETYDARLEQPGWNKPGFDDTHWEKALLVKPPGGTLVAEVLPPARVVETLKPVRMLTTKIPYNDGTNVVYDFGQNFSGWARIRISGPRGAKLTLKYGARIYPEDDTLDARSNLWYDSARQTDTYILKGEGTEEWEPRFTLHGFRYVEVQGFRHPPSLKNIEGRVVRTTVESSGTFACSNDLINKIHHNIQWTFMSSFQGIPQDAADRSERVAWLGDTSFVAEDYIYNYDMAAFWEKWLNDIQDSQKGDGAVPVVSPMHWRSLYLMWPPFVSTYAQQVWYLYQYYADTRVVQDHYDGLTKLVEFLGKNSTNYIISSGLGDHMEPQDNGYSRALPIHTPAALTSTAYYYYDSWILSQLAAVLGKADDAKRYSVLAQNIKEAFNREFFDKVSNQYATGSQTSNALPLYLRMVPEENVKAVMKNLIDDIVSKHQGHLSTGIIGSNALAQVLPRYGGAEVMYQIATQTTFPSLGYQISRDATTLCETYECNPWLSQNMKMLGSLEKFFYHDLAGIGLASPGFRRIVIKPQPVGDLRSVTATLRTVRGPIAVEWVRADTSGAVFSEAYTLDLNISIPVGTEADISVPKLGLREVVITESDKTLWQASAYVPGVPGITSGVDNADSVTFHAGSGSYKFSLSGSRF
jgi:alpha-L-rhamnosidase